MKIFGREPTLVLQTVSALLTFVVTFGFDWLSAEQAGLAVAVLAAVFGLINALAVRPVPPALFFGLVTTGAALLSTYGLDFSQERIGALQMVLVALVTFLTRQQVTPEADPAPLAPTPVSSRRPGSI